MCKQEISSKWKSMMWVKILIVSAVYTHVLYYVWFQRILFIYNEYTREQNVYNPLREKRPMSVPARPERE